LEREKGIAGDANFGVPTIDKKAPTREYERRKYKKNLHQGEKKEGPGKFAGKILGKNTFMCIEGRGPEEEK